MERDDFTCQACFVRYGELEAHHLFSYSTHKKLRYVQYNGVCLCTLCHNRFHFVYGFKDNTPTQFTRFQQIMIPFQIGSPTKKKIVKNKVKIIKR